MEKETKSILNTQEDGTNKLNDNNKKIQEINLKIKEIRTERDKCIKLTKVRELIEY